MSDPSTLTDPLACLIEEHRIFRRETKSFLEQVQRYEALIGTVPLDAAPVRGFARFLEQDVDRLHGGKEEKALFPFLSGHLPTEGGPVEVLLVEHGDLRGLQRTLAVAGEKLDSDGEAAEVQQSVLDSALRVHRLLDEHIDKEDTVLFPMVREVLSPKEMDDVREAFRAFEGEHGAILGRATGSSGAQERALPPFCAAGRARRDTAERA